MGFDQLSPKAHFLGVKSNRKISLLAIVWSLCDISSSKKALCKCPFYEILRIPVIPLMAKNTVVSGWHAAISPSVCFKGNRSSLANPQAVAHLCAENMGICQNYQGARGPDSSPPR